MFTKTHISIIARIALALAILSGFLTNIPVRAAGTIIYVKWDATGTNNGTSWKNAYRSLQSALSAASAGTEIWVAAGTYKPTGGTNRTTAFKLKNNVKIYGGFNGSEALRNQRSFNTNITVLSGDIGIMDVLSDNSYHVVIAEGITNSAILDGFTITAGNANGDLPNDRGGGISNIHAGPILTNLRFENNLAEHGAGMESSYGDPTLTNVVFINNVASGWGGGMFSFMSSPSLTEVTFTENSAIDGAGMNSQDSNIAIQDVTFHNNVASFRGGGLYNLNSLDGGQNFINVTFSKNSAEYGGGMFNDGNSPSLTNVTFFENTAIAAGGGIYNLNTYPTIHHATLTSNTANQGGAIRNEMGYATIVNSILYGNSGGEVSDTWETTKISYSIIQGDYPGTGNFDEDPMLSPLQENGGSTKTMALGASSPAIDAANNANCPETDQRGVLRPQGSYCDIGSYEADARTPVTLIVTKTEDTQDGACNDDCSLREAITAALHGDTIEFASSLSGQIITINSTLEVKKSITIDGDGLPARISISGNDSVTVFTIASGADVRLKGLVVTHGKAPQTEDGVFGGGIKNYGTLSITNSIISHNVADILAEGNGGGIQNLGILNITDCTIFNNSATYGGGILNLGKLLQIKNSLIDGNTAKEGGGIYNSSTMDIENSVISENRGRGGGIISIGKGKIVNSTFHANTSSEQGGGILNYGPLSVINSTFSDNSATTLGSGIFNGHGPLNLTNTILANSTSGYDCYNDSINNAKIGDNIKNLIENNAPLPNNCGTALITVDPKLGPLLHNGGPTKTIGLLSGSPAINTGSNAKCPTTDQRGVARPQDGYCDLGAFEYSKPSVPILKLPADGTLITTLQPMMDWKDSTANPDYYQIQISTNGGFTSFVVDETNLSTSSFMLPYALTPGMLYYWRIKAFNVSGGESAWSTVWTFKTPLAQPVLTSPTEAEALLIDRPTFEWNAVDDASQYILQVSGVNNFSTLLVNATLNATEYKMTKDLPQNKTLFWRVRAKSPAVTGPWSVKGSFKTGNPPSVPVLVVPTRNALVKVYTPKFDWRNSTVPTGTTFKHYEFQWDDNSGFNSPESITTTLGDRLNSDFTPGSDLAANTKFYWRVRAVNTMINPVTTAEEEHVSGWSPVWSLRTVVSAPTSLTMVPGDPNPLRPSFTWDAATGPGTVTGYTLQISTRADFSTLLVNSTTPNPFYSMTKNLPAGKMLYWRVRVNGANGPSTWSPTASFTP